MSRDPSAGFLPKKRSLSQDPAVLPEGYNRVGGVVETAQQLVTSFWLHAVGSSSGSAAVAPAVKGVSQPPGTPLLDGLRASQWLGHALAQGHHDHLLCMLYGHGSEKTRLDLWRYR